MIAYEKQLRYVVQDKIQSEKKKLLEKNFVEKKILGFFLRLNFVSDKLMLIITKRYIHPAINYDITLLL